MKWFKRFLAECVCRGIDLYMKMHRFGLRGQIEVVPMTNVEFREHLLQVFQGKKDKVEHYLETAPTTTPQEVQVTK